MNRLTKVVVAGLILFAPLSQAAWITNTQVTINRLIQWNDTDYVLVRFSDNTSCYVGPTEDRMYSLLLTLYTTKSPLQFHCYEDRTESLGGIVAHKLHRIVTQ